jgi:hypothetical protein
MKIDTKLLEKIGHLEDDNWVIETVDLEERYTGTRGEYKSTVIVTLKKKD